MKERTLSPTEKRLRTVTEDSLAASELAFVQDADFEEQQLPRVAKRKMLDQWREESGKGQANKTARTNLFHEHQQPARIMAMLSDDIMHLVIASIGIRGSHPPKETPVRC